METMQPVTGGFIRMRALTQRIPVAKSTIWNWVQQGKFPRPVKLSESVTAWPVAEVAQWEAAKRDEARKEGCH